MVVEPRGSSQGAVMTVNMNMNLNMNLMAKKQCSDIHVHVHNIHNIKYMYMYTTYTTLHTCTCTQHIEQIQHYIHVYAPAQCTHVYGVHVTYMITILYVYGCTGGGCTLWHGNHFEFQNIELCKSQCLIHHTTRDGARDSRTRDNVYLHARVIIGHFTGTLWIGFD